MFLKQKLFKTIFNLIISQEQLKKHLKHETTIKINK